MNTRILVAEDNKVSQKMALILLQRMGYQAHLAKNGQDALDAVSKMRYDLVLMDCLMPGMDGFEATDRIRQSQRHGRRTPIIAMTAKSDNQSRKKCLEAGMDDFISKPVTTEGLMGVLSRWCLSKQPLESALTSEPKNEDSSDLSSLFEGDPATLRHLTEVYIAQTADDFKMLRSLIRNREINEVHRIAHGSAGGSESFGVSTVAVPLREIEQHAKAGRLKGTLTLVAQAEREFKRWQAAKVADKPSASETRTQSPAFRILL